MLDIIGLQVDASSIAVISVGEAFGVEEVTSGVSGTVKLDGVTPVSVVVCSAMVEPRIAVEIEVVQSPDVVDCITK